MSGIAGINRSSKIELVNSMLNNMAHRGCDWRLVHEGDGVTYGASGLKIQDSDRVEFLSNSLATDHASQGHYAQVQALKSGFELKRDRVGVRPLYYGWTPDGAFCFASEVKGLLPATRDIHEMPPGHTFDGMQMTRDSGISVRVPMEGSPQSIAAGLRERLETAVVKRMGNGEVGSWLSGGLDSSLMAALARPHVTRLHTFTAGLPCAPDLEFARIVAEFIDSEHHERIIQPEEIFSVLVDVIYALESFDALLVRSSVMNYLVAKTASDFVPAVFSGEGGDELFAGYEYLKSLDPSDLPSELVDITNRLHNTALQRVDRCSSAFGTVAHVAFLDSDVVEYALQIPASLKLHDGVEKWILREAVRDVLPASVAIRPKSKFWQGAGVEDLLARYAEQKISDTDFNRERELANGVSLNTKEELHYYRIFREQFGEFDDLSWIGRTKGASIA
jgi:asparagine synthase (glutamine-hydrolysing)